MTALRVDLRAVRNEQLDSLRIAFPSRAHEGSVDGVQANVRHRGFCRMAGALARGDCFNARTEGRWLFQNNDVPCAVSPSLQPLPMRHRIRDVTDGELRS